MGLTRITFRGEFSDSSDIRFGRPSDLFVDASPEDVSAAVFGGLLVGPENEEWLLEVTRRGDGTTIWVQLHTFLGVESRNDGGKPRSFAPEAVLWIE